MFNPSSFSMFRFMFFLKCSKFFILVKYRPGLPNWEYTMWKFQDISATQILGQIKFGHFEAPKTAILTI